VTFDLRVHGDRPALLTSDTSLTYSELADRVDRWLAHLGPARRLVLLRGDTSVAFVVALLGALTGGHPVIVAPPARAGLPDAIAATYDPDVIVDTDAGTVDVRRSSSAHVFAPDLALMMSTSGSTGSPKLVRLSHGGLRANAAAIATYLDLSPADRGLLSLPLHYCYGLSILTSHLHVGAAAVVTGWSVLDPCLWDLAQRRGVTGLAGVPHTFDQLDSLGFPELPGLRYVTAAGGKLAPERVTGYLELGERRGWDFFVMYGQTEATARMAYLTPELARRHPSAIGVPVHGGRLRVDRPDESGVGQLVFTGPNVMLGYAHGPADLARPAELGELHTGDLARESAPGVFEVVGRQSRFAKIFGLRLDLDEIERRIPCAAACMEVDGAIGVVSPFPRAAEAVAELCDIPCWVVRDVLADVPLTASGKTDRPAVAALLRAAAVAEPAAAEENGSDVHALFERLLSRTDVTPDASFVSLGADSLSYVELSVRLGDLVDPLPSDWHRRTIAELESLRTTASDCPRKRRWTSVDPTVLLRAIAIVLIVGTHANLLTLMGGAHALLAVCGYNAARFLPTGRSPSRHLAQSAWRIALPSALWIGTLASVGLYAPTTAVFLNGALGANHWTIEWQFWFLEAVIWTLAGLAVALTIPSLRRFDLGHPFAAAMAFVAITGALRYGLVGVHAGPLDRYSVPVVAWCFALGWAAARAETMRDRLIVLVTSVVLLAGFFDDPSAKSVPRETIIAAAIACLLWAKPVRLPRWLATLCGTIAAASLSIYLTHWQVYPWLQDDHPLAATLSSLVVGVLYHRICHVVGGQLRMAINVNRGIERSADEHGDREHVEQQQHRDRGRQRTVDRRVGARDTEDPAHEVTAENPHQDREDGARDARPPGLPHRDRQVIQGRHEADREHEYGRPVHTA
jgi:acyl-coenzyme A synthetase/AMP-(fatty) acid ligase